MIAKIGRSSNLFGTLSYNNSKIEKENGEILMTNKFIETADGKYSVSQLAQSFEPYLLANRNTEKHTLHISLNPDPKDKVSDEKYREIAQLYMNEMGYGEQPFAVFKHTDIDRSHIHIVSVCIDEQGKKISDRFEKIRSMKVCRELENKFGLITAIGKKDQQNKDIFHAVNYNKGDIKSQIASVVRHLPSYYQFQSLGEYNALLSLFNITTEKVEGELQGEQKRGLLYFPLDGQGKKSGNPFKASLFGKNAGIDALEKHFTDCKNRSNDRLLKDNLKRQIIEVLYNSKGKQTFEETLKKSGIDTVIRRNDQSRIYGITFIDHKSKTVWNGSSLGKECSANVFQNKWNESDKNESEYDQDTNSKILRPVDENGNNTANSLALFDFSRFDDSNPFDVLGSIFPASQGEDHEETEFAHQMKRKKKRSRRK